jgi:hypothetical protein
MPQFFFHLHANGEVFCDEAGEWFPSAEKAEEHARQVAGELSRRCARRPINQRLSVVDESGTAVCDISLDAPVLETATSPPPGP